MKIRQGFVSNSSSSSFIVKLDKPIREYSFDEFYSKLCEGVVPCGEYSDMSSEDLAYKLFQDLNESTRTSVTDYWEHKEYELGENEYAVEYEDDCYFGADMEHNFMPYLNITKQRISHH